MKSFGAFLAVVGLIIAATGLVIYLAPSIPFLGRLPGDIRIERDTFRFYFPITTCILLSVIISLILMLVSRLR